MNDILKAYNIDPEKFATGVVKLLEDSLFAKKNYQLIDPNYTNGVTFDRWDYIYDNLPGYDWRDDVTFCDDLYKFLEGGFNLDNPDEQSRYDVIDRQFSNNTQIAEHIAYLEAKFFVEAYEAAHNTTEETSNA